MPRGPVVATPPPGSTPQNPNDVIKSAVWNAVVDDVYNIFNTPQPVEYGGTGAQTAVGGFDALNAKGTDIASATTTDIGAASGPYVEVTGSATITGLGTVAVGTERTVRFTGTPVLTYNASSLILYSKTTFTVPANTIMTFRSLGAGNWIETSQTKATGTWTVLPAFGGNSVGVTGSFKGRWERDRDTFKAWASVSFSNKGSSVGSFALAGLPVLAGSNLDKWAGTVGGMNSGFTSLIAGLTCFVNAGQNVIFIEAPTTAGGTLAADVNVTNTSQFSAFVEFEVA